MRVLIEKWCIFLVGIKQDKLGKTIRFLKLLLRYVTFLSKHYIARVLWDLCVFTAE